MNDVLESLHNKRDWQDIIRYSDTILVKCKNKRIVDISANEFLTRKHDDEFLYHRDLSFVDTFAAGYDYIVEYAYGDRPAPEHAAFFDVVLNVSQFNYDKKFITVLKNRYGKAGQLLSFEFVKNDDGKMGIKITERKYVE